MLRWSAPGTRGCREGKRSWKPLGETCHFPIDVLQRPGVITVTRAGNAVLVDHGDGLISLSFHLSEIDVRPGDAVTKGQVLGKVGTTGRSTGPHLFFGVRWHGARINPRWVLEDPAKIPPIR